MYQFKCKNLTENFNYDRKLNNNEIFKIIEFVSNKLKINVIIANFKPKDNT